MSIACVIITDSSSKRAVSAGNLVLEVALTIGVTRPDRIPTRHRGDPLFKAER